MVNFDTFHVCLNNVDICERIRNMTWLNDREVDWQIRYGERPSIEYYGTNVLSHDFHIMLNHVTIPWYECLFSATCYLYSCKERNMYVLWWNETSTEFVYSRWSYFLFGYSYYMILYHMPSSYYKNDCSSRLFIHVYQFSID